MLISSLGWQLSASMPIEFAAIAIDVAALFRAFAARGGVVVVVVSAVEIAAKLVAILRDPGLVVPYVAVHVTVAVIGKRRRHTHSH